MNWFRRISELVSAGERARRLHGAWLTKAMRSGKRYPRIPTREVRRGGFDYLRQMPGGRAVAERWWRDALDDVGRG